MKKAHILKWTCLTLIFAAVFTVPAGAWNAGDLWGRKTLAVPEDRVRFSTALTGELADSLEIAGVTVMPLTKSGHIAYEPKDSYSKKTDLGALLHIYIRNISGRDISPQVTFNGKTAGELIDLADNTVSWANTPDTRANRKYDKERPNADEFKNFIPLTTHIPAGAVDCYSINICDAKLLYGGIDFAVTADGKSASAKLYGDYPYVSVSRLMWRSTTGRRCYPDEVLYYIDNRSSTEAVVNSVRFYDGTDAYSLHYWNEADEKIASINNAGPVAAKQPACGTVRFRQPLAFKEYLVEFSITHNGRTYSIFQKTRPLVHSFDISVGWAGGDLKNESYIKAVSSMHFNTVIGAFGSDYYLRSAEFRQQYPIKIFGYNEGGRVGPEMQIENGVVTVYALDDIHAALPFGEPQLNDNAENFQPMRVFNKLLMYRNAPYATNITLSHEPSFYRYAGLSDLNHYDAYRVVAPFSDAWYLYFGYASREKYATYWGAPLETTGDYMRTLAKLNEPNPVAAWTQGANTWSGVKRFTKDPQYYYSPNPFELRIQAYENVANGAASLYWFNINTGDLLFHRPGARETLYVNRELSVVKDYLAHQVPYFYQRANNYDLNLNMGSDYALLYVTDLNYAAKDSMYQYKGVRPGQRFTFEVPAYLSAARSVVKVTKDGVAPVSGVAFEGNKLTLTDSVDATALYVLGGADIYDVLSAKYGEVIARETFNILDNESDYRQLQADAGYSDANPYVPDTYIEQSTPQIQLAYALAGFVIHPLEKMLTVLAALVYRIGRPLL
ncbi:MAG TPA: hypothetical protein PL044_03610 [Clostridiales bacterium]|nr:hypothetical protein [Clostridiales bacterium]HQH62933.1 hypothetical protein [Clostridiales bacterium]HQK72845.1 hypothetical protein [Clostridiales bacterium]